MKSLLFCTLLSITPFTVCGQDMSVKIVFEPEGIAEPIRELMLIIVDQTDTLFLRSESNVIGVPKKLFNRKVILHFKINGNDLVFHGVPVAWNNDFLEWTLVYDKKPFDKERFWMIRKWRKVKKAIYSLDYGNGKQVTEYL
ncbi:MAG: hypothetical protein ABIS36_25965 [Chryseolinea sp.]